MRYRRFGRTGVEVSELVLGGGWVGGLLITGDDAARRRAIRLCLERGVNWIDTAPQYGNGKSEEALGWLLGEIDPSFHVSTKVRLDPDRQGDIAGQVEASLEASLKRLRRPSVDLMQLHNPITRDGAGADASLAIERVLGPGGAIEALERVRDRGLTRWIGITALGENEALQEVVASGRIDSAQVYYNMLNPSAGRRAMPAGWADHDFTGLIAACRAHDVATMNIRVLAAGVLATERRHGRENPITSAAIADDEIRARRVFELVGEAYGTRAQTAMRFALANPDLSCVLVGVETLAHLEEALDAQAMGPLPQDVVERLEPLYGYNFGLA
jgi:D-threo-aldose 1-dehydrogenase